MTVHSLCHLLLTSHRFHLCSRRGNYRRRECQGAGGPQSLSAPGSHSIIYRFSWFSHVEPCFSIFFVILFKEIVGRHRQKKPSSRKDWALFLPVASEKKKEGNREYIEICCRLQVFYGYSNFNLIWEPFCLYKVSCMTIFPPCHATTTSRQAQLLESSFRTMRFYWFTLTRDATLWSLKLPTRGGS